MNDEQQLAVAERIGGLIFKFLNESITDNELLELHNWAYSSKNNQELFEGLVHSDELQKSIDFISQVDMDAAFHSIQQQIAKDKNELSGEKARIIDSRINWWRMSAAAAVFILIALSVAYFFVRPIKSASSQQNLAVIQDIPAPTGSKAVLTLSNGSKIILDNVHQSSLGKQGNAIITKQSDGEIIYAKVANENNLDVTYNTLSTGRGGQTEILLTDGSKVWLNAASSIKYPTSFNRKVRRVEIEGEAYFEIAHNKMMPFIVQIPGAEVRVLGTHFNVMAYKDEPISRTTLLEGSVQITEDNQSTYLKPGQQAKIGLGEKTDVIDNIDTTGVIAWKNDKFRFSIQSLESIMKQLERWYDIDVIYEGEKPSIRLTASISRRVNLSDVLKVLELNGVHFRVEAKKVIILK